MINTNNKIFIVKANVQGSLKIAFKVLNYYSTKYCLHLQYSAHKILAGM